MSKASRFLQPHPIKSRGNTIEVTLHAVCTCCPSKSYYYDEAQDCAAFGAGELKFSFDSVEEALIFLEENLPKLCSGYSWTSYITHHTQYGEWDFASTVEFIPFAKRSFTTTLITLGGLGIASTVEHAPFAR